MAASMRLVIQKSVCLLILVSSVTCNRPVPHYQSETHRAHPHHGGAQSGGKTAYQVSIVSRPSCPKAEVLDQVVAVARVLTLTERLVKPGTGKSLRSDFGEIVHMQNLMADNAMIVQRITEILAKACQNHITVPRGSLQWRSLVDTCNEYHKIDACSGKRAYRTYDGSCTVPSDPAAGKAFSCLSRVLPPSYFDGVSAFRKDKNKNPLPDPWMLESLFREQNGIGTEHLTHLFHQFAQSVAHDIYMLPLPKSPDDSREPLDCCKPENFLKSYCVNTPRAPYGKVYEQLNVTCISYPRHLPCARCAMGARSALNHQTSFLDLSEIYGIRNNVTNLVKPGGTLYVSKLIPMSVFHLIFRLNHNDLANKMKEINSHWNDDRIFQEARRINIAQKQMIAYAEFLPLLLGKDVADFFKLTIRNGYSTIYHTTADPRASVEFAGATFAAFRSTASTRFALLFANNTRHSISRENLVIHRTDNGDMVDALFRGLSGSIRSPTDPGPHQTEDDEETLEEEEQEERSNRHRGRIIPKFLAQDVHRGRDLGLRPYIDYLTFCFNRIVRNFEDLQDLMSPEAIELLSQIYPDVSDIDLVVGASLEYPSMGGIVGPTNGCLLGKHFINLRLGDPFHFETRYPNTIPAEPFTFGQIEEIRKTTVASVICRIYQSEPPRIIRKNPFVMPNETIPLDWTNCDEIPQPDWTVFKDPTTATKY